MIIISLLTNADVLCYVIGINYSSWAMVNVIFNSYIKSKAFAWWAKYNYILAAALDFGTAFAGIIIFFAVSYPGMFFSFSYFIFDRFDCKKMC